MLKGHKTSEKYLNPSVVKVDQSYQRIVRDRDIQKIVNDWNYDLVNMPKLSFRESTGEYYVFDGQHTLAAWRKHENDSPILCKVFYDLTYDDEVELFCQQNGRSKPVNKVQKAKGRYNRGDNDVRDIIDSAKEAGVEIAIANPTPGKNKCVAYVACEKSYKKLGRWKYAEALSVLRQAWDGDPRALQSTFIQGITEIYDVNIGQFDKLTLIKALSRYPTEYFERESKNNVGNVGQRYAIEFRKAYNKGKRLGKIYPVSGKE